MSILKKITQEELNFIETAWYNPVSQAEILFNNFDDFGKFSPTEYGYIRNYQIPMLSFESFIDYDAYKDLNEKEKFKLRQNVGDIVNTGARKTGKTVVTLRLDILLSILHDAGFPCAIYSIDDKRIRGVLNYVEQACKYHPIVKEWNVDTKFRPEIRFYSKKNGWELRGVNLTLKGKSPGENWYQIHAKKIWGEEVSFETQQVYEKRIEAVSEVGAVVRLAGMTNFTKHSPIGKQFYSFLKKHKALNLPQYVSVYSWDTDEKKARIEVYGGENSLNFRIFVDGEIVEDIVSELDMERVEVCYKRKTSIKRFEIPKDKLDHYKQILVVERPQNAERIFINADVGDNQTEILIHSEIADKFKYLYNITLYNLIKDEQLEIFEYLIEKLQANVIGIDCGDALGRVLSDDLEKLYSKDNVVRYMGQSKLDVDFEKDEKGNIKYENGKAVYRKELMAGWAVYLLKKNLYSGRHIIPYDNRLDEQLNSLVSRYVGNQKITQCILEDDHIFNAWKVFETSIFLKKDFNQTKPMATERPRGVSSWV